MLKSCRKSAAKLVVFAALLLPACTTFDDGGFSSFGNSLPGAGQPVSVEAYPDGEVLGVAKKQFSERNYGHASRYYERAVEVSPNNGEAWLGLAASYDRLRRFDLADRAYREAARYVGGRAEYFNNIGYSYLLRGDAGKARSSFLTARELDPANLTINNNLELLRDNASRSRRG